jgi:alkane 1-monooxygenase
MPSLTALRFALAWLLPLAVGAAAWFSPWAAWLTMLLIMVGLALAERVPALRHSPPASDGHALWYRTVTRVHVLLQGLLLALGLWLTRGTELGAMPLLAAMALGVAVGGVTGAQGITFAHELGHSRSRLDRALAWLLMASVNYSHFMVEHYRGHHVRAATHDDPASARRGETLWQFLPRTLAGSWASAWRLDAEQRRRFKQGLWRSPLLWAIAAQAVVLVTIAAWLGPLALIFWLAQSAYAVWQLEAINYIEHYGLVRQPRQGKPEPFAMQHAWNADHWLTNCITINLQRHSDHHMHAWKPYPTLQALPGPQLPTGYAGCIFIVAWPRRWFALMHPRLDALAQATSAAHG